MMKVYNLDTKKFMNHVAQSRGEVYLRMADGNVYNLKQDCAASALFGSMAMPEEGIEVSFSDTQDATCFFRYLIETSR